MGGNGDPYLTIIEADADDNIKGHHSVRVAFSGGNFPSDLKCMVAWLEKHKPKAQWKPSEKQMEELNLVIKANKDPKTNDLLYSLYEDLQKL